MKKLVALIVLLLPQLLFCQSVKWGRPHQKPDKNLHISQVIGRTPQAIYTLLTDMRDPALLPPVIQAFNTDLKLEKQIPLRLQYDQGTLNLEKAVLLNNRLHLLLSFNDLKTGKMRLYSQEINPENLQPYRAPRQVLELNWEEGIFTNPFGFETSPDHSKLLIYNRFPYASGNWLRNWLVVCDENAVPLWATEPVFPWQDQTIQLLGYKVNNEGTAMVLLSHTGMTIKDQAADPAYSIIAYSGKGKSKAYPFNLGSGRPQQMLLELAADGRMICGGFFGSLSGDLTGSFVLAIDPVSGQVALNQQQFGPEELASIEGSPRRLSDFQLRGLHLDSNGGIALIAEQFLPPFRGNGQRFYGQVLMVCFTQDLANCKIQCLDKTQVSYDQGYFDSFAYLAKDDQMLLLYNDKSKSPMRQATFNGRGRQFSALEHAGTEKIKVRPSNCAALSNQEMWIYAETLDKKSYQVALMQF